MSAIKRAKDILKLWEARPVAGDTSGWSRDDFQFFQEQRHAHAHGVGLGAIEALEALVAEVEKPITEAQIEAAAERFALANEDGPWEDLLDTHQEKYRDDALGALVAAREATK